MKVQQGGLCTEEAEDQPTVKERSTVLAAERGTLGAISCWLEEESRCCAQSVLERRLDSVLTSRPAASASEVVPPKTKKNRWSRQQDREALVESLIDQVVRDRGYVSTGGNAHDFKNFKSNGVAEQSVFWGLDTLGNGTDNGEDEKKDHGHNPVGAGLYGHVGSGDLGSDVYDLDDDEFTSGIP
ncbi:unnamed protein product, partial [Prorocentrum cordatum]